MAFQRTVKTAPWVPFAKILTARPRPQSPSKPSLSMICLAAALYDKGVSDVWRFTLRTRIGLQMESETMAEAKPMVALRTYFPYLNSNSGRLSRNWLFVRKNG